MHWRFPARIMSSRSLTSRHKESQQALHLDRHAIASKLGGMEDSSSLTEFSDERGFFFLTCDRVLPVTVRHHLNKDDEHGERIEPPKIKKTHDFRRSTVKEGTLIRFDDQESIGKINQLTAEEWR